MSGPATVTRTLCAFTVLSLAITAVCIVFVAPAGALSYTGWDFDFNVQPAVIDLGQTVNVSVHVYYWGNDSQNKPFQADAQDVTVTITSDYFNTIERTNSNGWLINADHPDVTGNLTYTAKVIFETEIKTKSVTLVVNPAGTSTVTPSGSPTPTVTPTPLPSPSLAPVNVTATPVPTVTVIPTVSDLPTPSPTPTPVPTKSPSGTLTILGTVSALAMVGFLARKKK